MSPYQDPRWQKLRLETMQRDGWKCVACRRTDRPLHVHHKRYRGRVWESPPQDLQTLCEDCHSDLGEHPKAGIWWEERQLGWPHSAVEYEHCPRCGSFDFVDYVEEREWGVETLGECAACGHLIRPDGAVNQGKCADLLHRLSHNNVSQWVREFYRNGKKP